ncbi:MAG: c-type cytochrome [bacterium]
MFDKRRIFTIGMISLTVFPVCSYAYIEDKNAKSSDEAVAASRGKEIYEGACAPCHGILGDGNGPAATSLDPHPRDFTSGIYKFRSTPSGELPTDDDIFRIISKGIPNTMMPAWKELLTELERRDVVAYIKTFSDDFAEYGPGEPIQIGEPPAKSPDSFLEGKSLFILMECWACHGVEGKGDGKSANSLTDDWGRKIKPFNFTKGNYKSGSDPKNIYTTLNTGLNGTPMPSFAGALLFGSDTFEDISYYAKAFSPIEIAVLQTYLSNQPSSEEIESMSDEDKQALSNRRSWSLVHYVKSFARKKSLFQQLF